MPATDSREKNPKPARKHSSLWSAHRNVCVCTEGDFNNEKDIFQAGRQAAEFNLFFMVSDFCPYPIQEHPCNPNTPQQNHNYNRTLKNYACSETAGESYEQECSLLRVREKEYCLMAEVKSPLSFISASL